MKKVLEKLSVSLKNCLDMYKEIAIKLQEEVKYDDIAITTLQEKIAEEDGYKYILGIFDEEYKSIIRIHELRFEWFKEAYTPEQLQTKRNKNLLHQVRRLQLGAEINAGKIDLVTTGFDEETRLMEEWKKGKGVEELENLRQKYPLPTMGDADYEFRDGILKIIDKEFDLNIVEPFTPDVDQDVFRLNHENGALKVEQYHSEGELHGPSSFFNNDGTLLARAWFYKGERVGKMWTYYPGGKLHSLQRYAHGLQEGISEYFYPDGLPKSILPYHHGLFNGDVTLFYPTGHHNRIIQFREGLRNGFERIWDRGGRLRMEGFYADDLPIGVAREWYTDGKIAREITYDEFSNHIETKRWTMEGELAQELSTLGEIYFEKMGDEMTKLTHSLENAVTGLAEIPKAVPANVDVNAGFTKLQEAMTELLKMDAEVKKVFNPEGGEETIWLNKSLQKLVEKEMLEQGKNIKEGIQEISKNIAKLVTQIKESPPQGGTDDKKQ